MLSTLARTATRRPLTVIALWVLFLLLAVVFGAFMTGGFSPILQIGLGLTLVVLLDATVVRMLLVPATMALLGRRAWWAPKPLRRVHYRIGLSEEAEPRPPVTTGV